MHGVGAETVRAAFARAGFPALREVPEQVEPDPDFPTVAFPNPEEPGALDLALALARSSGADLVLANDPDADRLGVAIPDATAEGGWRALTGDEIGSVLADHLLRTGRYGPDDVVATTVVSSRLLSKLADEAGVAYGEALTGFKWVVRTPAPGQRFVFGYEEALGYCVGELVRDKDGITAALVAADLAGRLRAGGSSLADRLDELARRHGAHVTRQRSIRVSGGDWLARVTATMAAVRSAPPLEVAGRAVVGVEDLAVADRFPVPSDVLVWTLDGARAIVRPSGTEPKLKCYAEAVVPVGDGSVAAARQQASTIVDDVLDDVTVPPPGRTGCDRPDRRGAASMWFHRTVTEVAPPRRPRRRTVVALLTATLAVVLAAVAVVATRDEEEPVVAATTTSTVPPTTTSSTTTTAPPTEVPASTDLATPKGEVPVYGSPEGAEIGTVGLWYGYPMTMPIVQEARTASGCGS